MCPFGLSAEIPQRFKDAKETNLVIFSPFEGELLFFQEHLRLTFPLTKEALFPENSHLHVLSLIAGMMATVLGP